jgi:hypothetical protein
MQTRPPSPSTSNGNMATPQEIRRRVELADTARSARRAAAAQQVGELAQHRAAIMKQLENVERELGHALSEAEDVIDIDELAEFTDIKPADLAEWLTGHTASRSRRKKATSTAGAPSKRRTPEPGTPVPGQAPTSPGSESAPGSSAAPERSAAQAS